MKCDICGGLMNEEETTYTLQIEDKFVVIENVPAKVCHQCGEKLFSPEVVEHLQMTIWNDEKPEKTIKTPIFNYKKAV